LVLNEESVVCANQKEKRKKDLGLYSTREVGKGGSPEGMPEQKTEKAGQKIQSSSLTFL
jgi:hypothetical protein